MAGIDMPAIKRRRDLLRPMDCLKKARLENTAIPMAAKSSMLSGFRRSSGITSMHEIISEIAAVSRCK